MALDVGGYFLLDEPTQGVDVATKAEIYELIRSLAAAGKAVLVASSDLEEVMEIGDRILALRRATSSPNLAIRR